MSGHSPMRRLVSTLLAAACWLALAGTAQAACAVTDEGVAEADVAFVGTLAFASDDGSVGRFNVEDVWESGGLNLTSPVSVQAQPGLFTMPPAGAGQLRFLILASAVEGAPTITGNDCSSWAFPWDASYAAFRPADASPPSGAAPSGEGPSSGSDSPTALWVVLGAAAVVVLVAWLAFRRRPSG